MEKISEKIRDAIRDSGLSLNALAAETGIDDGILSRFMRGQRSITLDTAETLCQFLKLELRTAKRRQPARKK